MAKKRRKARRSKKARKHSKKSRSHKGHIPLSILERRLKKLTTIVHKRRGR